MNCTFIKPILIENQNWKTLDSFIKETFLITKAIAKESCFPFRQVQWSFCPTNITDYRYEYLHNLRLKDFNERYDVI